jgi:macrodomain Ter protein organizer (MatP/YcbG family)
MAKDTKNINIEISIECWKKLKMISIHKDMTLQDVVKEVLEKATANKKVLPEIQEI